MITNTTELKNHIYDVCYTLSGEGGSSEKSIQIYRNKSNQWSYVIAGCTPASVNTQFLNNVPADKLKNWTITKTSTHLKVVCNRVTVLNFNFTTDYKPDSENSQQVWLKRCTNIRLVSCYNSDLLVLNTGG